MSVTVLPSFRQARPPEAMADASTLHRRLAHWNHRRLAVGKPDEHWRADLQEEHEMRLFEGRFIEAFRAEVAGAAAAAPSSRDEASDALQPILHADPARDAEGS